MIVLLGKVFSFFFVLGILVLIHELGHFLTAKRLGVRVEVFSFGFGSRPHAIFYNLHEACHRNKSIH